MDRTNYRPIENNPEQRARTRMEAFPAKAVVLFVALAAAGITLAAMASELATGSDQTVLGEIGISIFGGSLAFFLVEMFHWDRERKTGK